MSQLNAQVLESAHSSREIVSVNPTSTVTPSDLATDLVVSQLGLLPRASSDLIDPPSTDLLPTAAGVIIRNQAELHFTDAVSGEKFTVLSSISQLSVATQFRFSVMGQHQRKAYSNTTVTLAHRIQNQGNVSDDYHISVVQTKGTFQSDQLRVLHDVNGNGYLDDDDVEVDRTGELLAGEFVDLLIVLDVPVSAVAPDSASIELVIVSVNGNVDAQSIENTILIVDGASFALSQQNSPACEVPLFPGETINYAIDYINTGDSYPLAHEITVDGISRVGVLLTESVPANTKLSSASLPKYSATTAIGVVQIVGSDEWVSIEQWNGVDGVTTVGVLIPVGDLAPGIRGFFHFDVVVQPAALDHTRIVNGASVDLDNDGQADFLSNTVCNSFATVAGATVAELLFIEPDVAVLARKDSTDVTLKSEFKPTRVYRLDNGVSDYDRVRDGVYIELRGASMNRSPLQDGANLSEPLAATLSSQLTGDSIRVLMIETGENTGIFRNARSIGLSENRRANNSICPGEVKGQLFADYKSLVADCVLQSAVGDKLTASFVDFGFNISLDDLASVDPYGITFDSQSLKPVPGTVVRVVDKKSNAVMTDPGTGDALELVSNEQGRYTIPRLPQGTDFFLDVYPPIGYAFPSVVQPEALPGFQVGPYSYGKDGLPGGIGTGFPTTQTRISEAPVAVDLPLDGVALTTILLLDKQALTEETAPGEFVSYQIDIRNSGEDSLSEIKVSDRLPYGYRYVSGSSQLDGKAIVDPQGGNGPNLIYLLGDLPSGQKTSLSYALKVTAAALDSDGINRASATAQTPLGSVISSPSVSSKVAIRQRGILSDRATVFGKVYVDADCDGLQNDAEWPIAGVRLWMEDGSYVITDEDGLFSLYGLSPGLHVLKVDDSTLPDHLTLKPIDNRNAADGDSRFVELSGGDFHRADFAAFCPGDFESEVLEELKERQYAASGNSKLSEALEFDPLRRDKTERDHWRHAAPDGDISSGFLEEAGEKKGEVSNSESGSLAASDLDTATKPVRELPQLAQPTKVASEKMPLPKVLASSITQMQARAGTWLWPASDISRDGRFMVVVRNGATPELFVNGQPISENKIGERILNKSAQAQIVAWYGVDLNAGENKVEIRGKDAFGNTRIMARKTVKRPATGAEIVLRAKDDTIAADGGDSTLAVEIKIVDSNGYPALGVYFVTLENSDGSWVEADIRDSQPGHQIKVENGRAVAHYQSSAYTGIVNLRVSSGSMLSELRIAQVAYARPLIGVGIVEGGVVWNSLKAKQFSPTEQANKLSDGHDTDGRVAMFLKGEVKGDMQLTLSYDSEKDNQSDLLRDINPGQEYALYGDASVRGYEGQSRSKLYAKLQKGKNSIMWGDYLTDSSPALDDLGQNQRTLTGANAVLDTGATRVHAFAARPRDERRVEELPGNGTAMLFQLQGAPIVPNSEVVEIVTRDEANFGLILSSARLTRLNDYVIDAVTGHVRFSQAIPTFDEGLGRNYIRISYDQVSGGDEYTVAGVRLRHQLGDSSSIGGSFTENSHEVQGSRLSSVWVQHAPGNNTRIGLGLGYMEHRDGSKSGLAGRVNVEHTWDPEKDSHSSFTFGHAEEGFDNPGAGVSEGREEIRIAHRQKLSNTTRLRAEASHSKSLSTDDTRRRGELRIDKAFGSASIHGGVKVLSEIKAAQRETFSTVLLGASRKFILLGRPSNVGFEFERSLTQQRREGLKLTSSFQLHDKVDAYARYERERGLVNLLATGSQSSSESLVAGLEANFSNATKVYSEYRAKGILGDRQLENGSGVRSSYEIQEGLTVAPALEIIKGLDGSQSKDSVALSVGLFHVGNPNSQTSLHGEVRVSDTENYFGFRGSHALRLNLDWSLLFRENLTRLVPDEGEMTSQHSFITALSRRPKLDNRHHMLFMYNWKVDYSPDVGGDRKTHLISTHQNYEISDYLEISGRAGGKWQQSFLNSRTVSSTALLFDTRLNWDINRRFDVDIRTGWLATDSGQEKRYSLGLGASYLLNKNLRIGVAYNQIGFREEDLDPEGYNSRGLRAGFQYKFDEDLFSWLKPRALSDGRER